MFSQCTLAFESQNYGWTESFYRPNPSVNLVPELTALRTLAQKRIMMCGRETSITFLKVSNTSVTGDVLLENRRNNPFVGDSQEASEVPSTAILIKRKSVNNVESSILYARGNFDSLLTNGGLIDESFDKGITAFSGFKGELKKGWGFLSVDKTLQIKPNISNVTNDSDGHIVFQLPANSIPQNLVGKKAKVYVSGIQGATSANGQFIVDVVDRSTLRTRKRLPIFPYLGFGRVTYSPIKFVAIADATMERSVHRQCGTPLFLSRGRRRTR